VKKPIIFAAFFWFCAVLFASPSWERENRITIEFEGNPTTGYSWIYTMEPGGIVREVSAEYKGASAAENRAGRGGVFVFVFESIKPGEVELRFSYTRPWESGVEPVKTESYVLAVDEAGKIVVRGSG
jgi:predicted secreted protein